MYKIVPVKKTTVKSTHDYLFSDFNSFYKIANVVTVSLKGLYSIGITTEDAEAVKEFLQKEEKYKHLDISIYMPEVIVEHMSLYNIQMNVADQMKSFDVFMEMVSSKNLLFDKGAVYTLYSSIEHSVQEMSNAVSLLYNKYGPHCKITEKMLAEDFILNKIVYPRTVLLAYLWLDRWRDAKLKKCLSDVGSDVALAACIKRISEFQKAKVDYYRKGESSKLIKSLDTYRVNLMYRVLVTDRGNLRDLTLLFEMYERGLTNYDFVYK